MAEVSNCVPALDPISDQIIWEKVYGKVKSSKGYSPLELDKISRQSNDGKHKEGCGVRLSSFEANQSFPRISRSQRRFGSRNFNCLPQPSSLPRLNMEHICGVGQNSLSFARVTAPMSQNSIAEQKSCSKLSQGNSSFLNSFGPPSSSCLPVFNPSKAVFTIDSQSTEILVVNDAACNLLEYPTSELIGTHLRDLMVRTKTQTALSEEHLDGELNHVVSFCGKVVDMIAKSGDIIPVSLWITHLQADETGGNNRCLAVAEPVERAVAQIVIDSQGCILSADKCTAALFQYGQNELLGMDLKTLVPSFHLPKDSTKCLSLDEKKQKATGRTLDGENFPLSLILDEFPVADGATNYSVVIWVFASMSGLVVLGSDGKIEGCNHHFVQMMFGYSRSELMGKSVTKIIPDFCDKGFDERKGDTYCGSLPSSSTICCDESKKNTLETTSPASKKNSQINETKGRQSLASVDEIIDSVGKLNLAYFSLSHSETEPETPKHQRRQRSIIGSRNQIEIETPKHQRRQRSLLGVERGKNILSGVNDTLGTPVKEMMGDSMQQCKDKSDSGSIIPMDQSEDLMVTSTPATNSKGWARKNIIDWKGDGMGPEENEGPSSTSRNHNNGGNSTKSPDLYANGEYFAYGLHKDGALLSVKYRVQSAILTGSNQLVYCVWIAKNTNPDAEVTSNVDGGSYNEFKGNYVGNLTLANTDENSSVGTADHCDGLTKTKKTNSGNNNSVQNNVTEKFSNAEAASNHKVIEGGKGESEDDDDIIGGYSMEQGEYQQKYSTLHQIGKGAFGCVCMGYRRLDHLLVITKFIRKHKVGEESWVVDPKLGRKVPLEISLLTTLKHPNIVSIHDVCENHTYFQLVMEKHGAGMDLFEFIDRNPDLDELLISYIFRQVASAVAYLHSLQILHRDIKDENIILNEAFHAKLIDFGSATFSSPGRLFSNFYGTVEYCSPEVLAGNKYAGPELEMWSMGVTLYVLCFGENPFFDVEETLKAELNPPYTVSEGLQELLEWMLEKDPNRRCTVQELVEHPWLSQHVDISQYVFSEVVQCKPHEENPPTHYDEREDIGSSYFSGTFLGDAEEIKEGEEDVGGAGDGKEKNKYVDSVLEPSCHQSSSFSSFTRISPSSSSHSVASSASYHSASHSCRSTSSTVTSTHSVLSLGSEDGHESKENGYCSSSYMESSRAEMKRKGNSRKEVKRRLLREDESLTQDDLDGEDTEKDDTNSVLSSLGVHMKLSGEGENKSEIHTRTEDEEFNFDELDEDSPYDELDSFS